MPLVISYQSQTVQGVDSVDALAEILGQTDFGGRNWGAGDKVLFEDGTESRIVTVPGGSFHVWPTPQPADLEAVRAEVSQMLGNGQLATRPIASWQELSAAISEAQYPRPSPFRESRMIAAIRTHFLEAGWWLAAAAAFMGTSALIGRDHWAPWWGVCGLAWIAGLVVGAVTVVVLVRLWPNSRYRTQHKIDGLGYVWSWLDFVAPYTQMVILIVIGVAIVKWWRG